MSDASLEQWLQHLETLHPNVMELGLDRVTTVAQALELLPVACSVVTVAGTNGKGSTVAVLEALLEESGSLAGCSTSPHFLKFNERIRVGGREVDDEDIVAAFEAIEAVRGNTSLTYFEFSTLAALQVFRCAGVEVVVLEVGLGGRLDAANIVDPTVAVITSIDLDHQEWLGETRGAIAREKAGIMRPGIPVVIADPEPPAELFDCAQAVGADPIKQLDKDFGFSTSDGNWQGWLSQHSGGGRRDFPCLPCGPLLPVNICAALQAAALLQVDLSDEQIVRALGAVSSIGRRQEEQIGGKHYLLDVAHNPAAVYKLLEYIDTSHCNKRVIALFSAMGDKALAEMLDICADRFDGWFLADQPNNERAVVAAEVADLLRARGQGMISISKNIRQAYRRAQSVMVEGDVLVVFGSFFTVAGVLPQLDKDRRKNGTC